MRKYFCVTAAFFWTVAHSASATIDCKSETRKELAKNGYTSCSIQKVCGPAQTIFESSFSLASFTQHEPLKQYLQSNGCKSVVLMSDGTVGAAPGVGIFEGVKMVSTNCSLVKETAGCPVDSPNSHVKPLQVQVGFEKSKVHLSGYQLCLRLPTPETRTTGQSGKEQPTAPAK